MQPLRIRLRSVKRVSGPINAEKGSTAQTVRVCDGQNPNRWATVRLREEVYDTKKYSVIEVLEVSKDTQVAFITPDIYL